MRIDAEQGDEDDRGNPARRGRRRLGDAAEPGDRQRRRRRAGVEGEGASGLDAGKQRDAGDVRYADLAADGMVAGDRTGRQLGGENVGEGGFERLALGRGQSGDIIAPRGAQAAAQHGLDGVGGTAMAVCRKIL